MDQVYPLLLQYWPQLNVPAEASVLVPLCGKSVDMYWLAEQECRVTGIDVAEKAILEFMKEYPGHFTGRRISGFSVFESDNITLWQGDFMKLPPDKIEAPDIIYDKAALIAFPPDSRRIYAEKMLELNRSHTRILLQTFEYTQSEMNGPPFAVFQEEVKELFGDRFRVTTLHNSPRPDLLARFEPRGLESYLREVLYILDPHK